MDPLPDLNECIVMSAEIATVLGDSNTKHTDANIGNTNIVLWVIAGRLAQVVDELRKDKEPTIFPGEIPPPTVGPN